MATKKVVKSKFTGFKKASLVSKTISKGRKNREKILEERFKDVCEALKEKIDYESSKLGYSSMLWYYKDWLVNEEDSARIKYMLEQQGYTVYYKKNIPGKALKIIWSEEGEGIEYNEFINNTENLSEKKLEKRMIDTYGYRLRHK